MMDLRELIVRSGTICESDCKFGVKLYYDYLYGELTKL